PFCENRRTATSIICSRRSSAAIRGACFGSAESTLFLDVIAGGFELIFFQPSSFLSMFIADLCNVHRETPLAPRSFVSMRLLTIASYNLASGIYKRRFISREKVRIVEFGRRD